MCCYKPESISTCYQNSVGINPITTWCIYTISECIVNCENHTGSGRNTYCISNRKSGSQYGTGICCELPGSFIIIHIRNNFYNDFSISRRAGCCSPELYKRKKYEQGE